MDCNQQSGRTSSRRQRTCRRTSESIVNLPQNEEEALVKFVKGGKRAIVLRSLIIPPDAPEGSTAKIKWTSNNYYEIKILKISDIHAELSALDTELFLQQEEALINTAYDASSSDSECEEPEAIGRKRKYITKNLTNAKNVIQKKQKNTKRNLKEIMERHTAQLERHPPQMQVSLSSTANAISASMNYLTNSYGSHFEPVAPLPVQKSRVPFSLDASSSAVSSNIMNIQHEIDVNELATSPLPQMISQENDIEQLREELLRNNAFVDTTEDTIAP